MGEPDSNNVQRSVEDGVIRRYLLEDPSVAPEARDAIEDASFNDDDLFRHLLEIEDDLVDEHVFGALSPADNVLFEQALKRSARVQSKVALAKALVHLASKRSTDSVLGWLLGWLRQVLEIVARRPFAFALAGAAMVLIVCSLLVYRDMSGRRRTPEIAKVPAAPPKVSPPIPQPRLPEVDRQAVEAKKRLQPILSFLLPPPELTRSSGKATVIRIPQGDSLVRLRMRRGDEAFPAYEARISTPTNVTILRGEHLKPFVTGQFKAVVLSISGRTLIPGTYILSLRGEYSDGRREDLDDYTFQVERL